MSRSLPGFATSHSWAKRIVRGYRKTEWQKARERNEALDTRIYARAAASQFGMDRFGPQHWVGLEQKMGIKAMALPPQPVPSPAPQLPPPDFSRNEPAADPF